MKAIYLNSYGDADKACEIKETEKPRPEKGQVLIKVEAFGLNFADVIARRGKYPDAPKNPAVLGYDVAGTIEALGPDTHEFAIGDRVAALTRFGGYAEYAATMVEGVARIPDNFDTALATALATQACTAYYCAEESVTLNPQDNVLIHAAAGGVGTILVQIAKHRGCTIFGTASTGKMDYLRSIGVDHPIDYTKEDFSSAVSKILGKDRIDVVFDSIGGKTFRESWKLIGAGGSMVNFGAAAQMDGGALKALGMAFNFGLYSPLQLLMKSKSMNAVNMLRIADYKPAVFAKVFNGVMEYARRGIINPTLAKKYNAEDIAEAHAFLESRKSIGKVVLEW